MLFRAIVVVLIALAGLCGANPLQPSLRDYVHTAWTQHDGIALSEIIDIAQTTDGYLWLTTTGEGLLRFDGVRFVPQPSPCPRSGNIQSDGAGGLWMLCDYRFFHRDPSGRFQAQDEQLLPSTYSRKAMTFFVDRQRRLWFWGRSLAYLRPDGSRGPDIPGTERPRDAVFCSFAEDAGGDIWFGSDSGLLRIHNDRPERVLKGWVSGLAPSSAGGIYALSQGRSLLRVTSRSIETVTTFGPETVISSGSTLVETEAGVWVSTQSRGVALVHNGQIDFLGKREGLSNDSPSSLFADREGSLWVPTTIGLHRFRAPLAYMMSPADGMPSGMPLFIYEDRKRALWIATNAMTVRLESLSGRRSTFKHLYRSIGEDQAGRIWLADKQDIGYLRNDVFVPVRDSAGQRISDVFSFRADPAGNLWALSYATGLYRINGLQPELKINRARAVRFLIPGSDEIWLEFEDRVLQFTRGQELIHDGKSTGGPAGARTRAIEEDDGKSIWVGGASGLARWRNRQWTRWTVEQGLPGTGKIFEITPDSLGHLWLVNDAGILVLDRRQLDDTPDGQPRRLTYMRIGSLDRIQPHHGGVMWSPRVAKSRDGKLFFATLDGIAVIDPARIATQSFAPPIVLETVLVNRRLVATDSTARFVEPDDVQFEYTSLSLRNPENVRFRYRLEGRDNDWIEAGTQRRAIYSALKPGSYRFHVIGSGSEGVWNDVGAVYTFQIAAPYYKTPWFLAALALAIATMAWLFYRYRLGLESERIRVRMEAQAGERLRIAQDMHDTLLQGIQSSAYLMGAAIETLDAQPAESRRLLQRALGMVGDSAVEARGMLSSLRDATALPPPLLSRLQALAADEPVLYPNPPQVSFEVVGAVQKIRPQLAEDLYQIACEALRNASRHAAARNIRLALQFTPGALRLTVIDDGVGIDPALKNTGRESHFGLQGMRERATRHGGTLSIESEANTGTHVIFAIKLPD